MVLSFVFDINTIFARTQRIIQPKKYFLWCRSTQKNVRFWGRFLRPRSLQIAKIVVYYIRILFHINYICYGCDREEKDRAMQRERRILLKALPWCSLLCAREPSRVFGRFASLSASKIQTRVEPRTPPLT